MRAIAFVGIVVLSVGAAPSQRGGTAPLGPLSAQWELAARVYFPDGRTVAAFDGPHKDSSLRPVTRDFTTVETLCVYNAPFSTDGAAYGWNVTVTPLRETATELVVRVDWRRTFDRGTALSTPMESLQLTLRPNEGRIPIDYLRQDKTTAGRCTAIGMMLEIRIAR